VTEAAAPPRLTEADAQAYQQERSRLVRAQIEADLGITRAEIERIRGAYVALFPVDPEARRAELEALKRELHLDEPEPTTPATKRRRTKMADPLSPVGSTSPSRVLRRRRTPIRYRRPSRPRWSGRVSLPIWNFRSLSRSSDRHQGPNPLGHHVQAFDGSRSGRRPVWKRVGLGGIRLVAQPPIRSATACRAEHRRPPRPLNLKGRTATPPTPRLQLPPRPRLAEAALLSILVTLLIAHHNQPAVKSVS
jgi:hypothetical protein